jgi:hypothetical protein
MRLGRNKFIPFLATAHRQDEEHPSHFSIHMRYVTALLYASPINKDAPPPPRFSTRAVLGVGIGSDILVPFLYYIFENMTFDVRTHPLAFKLLGLALLLSIFSGLVGTTLGSAMWAKRAENGAVAMVVFGVILLVLIYDNRVRIGFDDPKMLVIPFGFLVVLSLLIGRVIGYVASTRQSSSSQ